ncbi:MAG: P27 family phage terminase small subunit, partial [Actinomycetota bacterium]
QFVRARQASEHVEKYGIVAQSVSGDVKASPLLKAERDAAAQFLRFAEHYGLTIAARMRLGLMRLQGASMAQTLAKGLEE